MEVLKSERQLRKMCPKINNKSNAFSESIIFFTARKKMKPKINNENLKYLYNNKL